MLLGLDVRGAPTAPPSIDWVLMMEWLWMSAPNCACAGAAEGFNVDTN
jgi:hypothetical protein